MPGKRYIKQHDLTKPFKATFTAHCTQDESDGRSSWTEEVNLIFKNERQFDFFNHDRNMLISVFESLVRYDENGNEKKGVEIDCPYLKESGESCVFETEDTDVPEYDDDPDSPTYKEDC